MSTSVILFLGRMVFPKADNASSQVSPTVHEHGPDKRGEQAYYEARGVPNCHVDLPDAGREVRDLHDDDNIMILCAMGKAGTQETREGSEGR